MTRKVYCKLYKEELEGLERPPYPGKKGEEIFEQISKQAWQTWQEQQTRLINERHLNMFNPEDRRYITEQMDRFFNGETVDQAEGFVPKAND